VIATGAVGVCNNLSVPFSRSAVPFGRSLGPAFSRYVLTAKGVRK
jgi:hypothetical protein